MTRGSVSVVTDEDRSLPPPLTNIRSLPFGTYEMRVVHLEMREGSFGSSSAQASYHMDNTPVAVLSLGDRRYVVDDAQQFKIGSVRGPAPQLHQWYRVTVSAPNSESAIVEDRTRGASVKYEAISGPTAE